jgi:hypothetical protein
MNAEEKNKTAGIDVPKKEKLSAEDDREMELFIQNSQGYCQKVYGGKNFEDAEIDELRKEIKETNKEIKKIKSEWGLA